MDPLEMINEGFSEGIRKMGELFDRGEVFLPGLIIASEAMVAAVAILEQALPGDQVGKKLGTVVIGTVEGDVHDIGKGIVATMLRVYGFEVHDLGRDVPIGDFVEKVKEVQADVVGSSALMTTTQMGQKKLEQALKEAGIRDQVKTMVGGAVATQHWADRIGADLYAESATDAVMVLKETFSR
jgi:corrinoid protein of di/trimethylamine methyltransferase